MMWSVVAAPASASAQTPKGEAPTEHQKRAQERQAKTEAYERSIDSIVVARRYAFIPSTFWMEPAGDPRTIRNPMFRIDVREKDVDVCIPYFRGVVPPYAIAVINYTVTPDAYFAEQTDHGWKITFSSSLYSANMYNFEFTVYKKTGEMELKLTTDIFNPVTYSGSIMELR